MKKISFKIDKQNYPILIFFLLSFIPFYWLRGHPVGWGDTGVFAFFHNAAYLFNPFKYSWISQYSMGIPSGQLVTLLPQSVLFILLSSLGLSSYVQQAFAYFLILFLSMLFMYLFVYELFDYRNDKKFIATISAIFYVFNPLVMITYWYTGIIVVYLMPFVPSILFFYLKVLKTQRFIYIFLISIIFSIFSSVFLNPGFAVPIIMILILYFIYQLALRWRSNKDSVKKMSIYTAVVIIFIFLSNAWFILPSMLSFTLLSETYRAAIEAMDPWQTLVATSHAVSLVTLFRFFPLKLDSRVWAYKDVVWRYYYDNILFILLGIFIFFVITVPLILRRKDENILFFTLLLVIGIFLYLGLNPPFGFIFGYLFKNIPYFVGFRSLNKFIPIILVSSSVLFGIGINFLYILSRYKIGVQCSKLIPVILVFLACGVYVFPMWTGSIVNTPITIRGNEISSFVEVPPYYQDIAKYFHDDSSDYRILSLPLRPSTYVRFTWKYGYDGPDATWLLYKHETISYLMGNYYPSAKILSKLESQNSNNFYRIISFFGIKYIVIQNDVDIIHGNYDWKSTKKLISQQELKLLLKRLGVPFVRSFGKLDLYKLSDEYFLPHIYPATTLATVVGGINDLPSLVTLDDFQTTNGIFFQRFLENKQRRFILSKSSEKLVTNTPAIVKSKGKEYTVDNYVVPENGEYEVLVKAEDELKNRDSRVFSLKVDGSIVSKTPVFRSDGWVSLGDFSFKRGGHRLSLYAVDKKGKDTPVERAYIVLRKGKPAANPPPMIAFKKINPTKYVVSVENASQPFFLVFSESYHPQWKAYVKSGVGSREMGDEIVAEYPKLGVREARHEMSFIPGDISYLFAKPISDDNHFLVNGYANAWYIDPTKVDKDGDGKFAITLYFWPQSLFYLGLMISGLTFLGCVGYLVWDWRRKRFILSVL